MATHEPTWLSMLSIIKEDKKKKKKEDLSGWSAFFFYDLLCRLFGWHYKENLAYRNATLRQ